MSNDSEIHDLMVKSLKGSLGPTEAAALDDWIHQSPDNKADFDRITDLDQFQARLKSLDRYDAAISWNKVRNMLPETRRNIFFRFNIFKAAAVFVSILLLTGSVFFVVQRRMSTEMPIPKLQDEVKAPQVSKATLSLADGRVIPLEELTPGIELVEGDVLLVRNADGSVSYQSLQKANDPRASYNTISNPTGSTVVDVVLSDGTRVWLNAGSSITYPTVFHGSIRAVEISGEAYFEVAKHSRMPFWVKKDDLTIKVLGTAFNINAYKNESQVDVTLLHGLVSVSKVGWDQERKLRPSQKLIIGTRVSLMDDVDIESIIAWKNGYFSFDKADIKTILRQIERWYDVEVEVGDKYLDRRFSGEISRMSNVSKVLQVLKENDIRFSIDGKKITIQ